MPRNIINKEDFLEYRVHQKETSTSPLIFSPSSSFFAVSALKSYRPGRRAAGTTAAVFVFYAVFIWLFIWFQKVLLIGHLKGNGEITASQFPEAHEAYRKIAEGLQIRKIPPLFILQEEERSTPSLCVFRTKLHCCLFRNIQHVRIFPEIVQFVLAHELGRKETISSNASGPFPRRSSPSWRRRIREAASIPATSARPSAEKSIQGLILLAAGKDIFSKVKVELH